VGCIYNRVITVGCRINMKKLDILNLILFPLAIYQIVFNGGSAWVFISWIYVVIVLLTRGLRFLNRKKQKELDKQESTQWF